MKRESKSKAAKGASSGINWPGYGSRADIVVSMTHDSITHSMYHGMNDTVLVFHYVVVNALFNIIHVATSDSVPEWRT